MFPRVDNILVDHRPPIRIRVIAVADELVEGLSQRATRYLIGHMPPLGPWLLRVMLRDDAEGALVLRKRDFG